LTISIKQPPSLCAAAHAVQRITDAAVAIGLTKHHPDGDSRTIAVLEGELRAAVQEATYDLGISWQEVGDVLGIRRGNAYQKFRRKPGQ
jgi:hypothetical protein